MENTIEQRDKRNLAPKQSFMGINFNRWTVQELVVLGVFSASAKISTLLVTIMSGGPNPIGFIAKNLIFTTMLVIMLYRVRKPGTLCLFVAINLIVSMLLLGASVTLIPTAMAAAILAEMMVFCSGGMTKRWGPVLAVGMYDLLSKFFSVFASWVVARENPGMIVIAVILVSIGYIGSIGGLFTGVKFVKELKHAGIIRGE